MPGRAQKNRPPAARTLLFMPTPSPCTNAHIGKVKAPSAAELDKALGPVKKIWSQLLADLAAQGIDVQEWGSSVKETWLVAARETRRPRNRVPCSW
jgi:hypothetical protein